MSDEITKEEIADHYTRMGHSVTLINAVIEGTKYSNETSEEKQKCVITVVFSKDSQGALWRT